MRKKIKTKKIKILSKKQRKNQRKFEIIFYIPTKTLKILILFLAIGFIIYLNLFFYSNSNSNFEEEEEEIIMESDKYQNFDKLKNQTTDPVFSKVFEQINIIQHLFSNKIESYKKHKNIIQITLSINNNIDYKYILLVSMYSLLTNCNKEKSFIIYHILCTPDFNATSVTIYKSLFKKFSHNVEMVFYNMGNLFSNRKNARFSEATLYRVLAPLFIDSDRLIHLDGDTLVFKDLNEMYNLDFNDNYIFGMYDFLTYGVDYLGLKSNIYINAGVILLNLKKLREDNKVIEFLNLTNSKINLVNYDQTLFNYLLHPKIGRLPSKYSIFNFADKSDIEFYIRNLRTKVPIEEIEEALKDPTVVHNTLCYPKLWSINTVYQTGYTSCGVRHNCSCQRDFNLWHSFANQTDYYDEIAKFTGVKKDN